MLLMSSFQPAHLHSLLSRAPLTPSHPHTFTPSHPHSLTVTQSHRHHHFTPSLTDTDTLTPGLPLAFSHLSLGLTSTPPHSSHLSHPHPHTPRTLALTSLCRCRRILHVSVFSSSLSPSPESETCRGQAEMATPAFAAKEPHLGRR